MQAQRLAISDNKSSLSFPHSVFLHRIWSGSLRNLGKTVFLNASNCLYSDGKKSLYFYTADMTAKLKWKNRSLLLKAYMYKLLKILMNLY